MNKNMFTLAELENAFEIGRIIQSLINDGAIEAEDSKDVFQFAMDLAVEFETEYPETEDYYYDIDVFVRRRIVEEFEES